MSDPHTEAPIDPADVAIVTVTVVRRLERVTGDVILRLEQARGGLQFLSPAQFQFYTDALRALDLLKASLN